MAYEAQSTLQISANAAEVIAANRFVNWAGTTAADALKCSIADSTEMANGISMDNAEAAGDSIPVAIAGVYYLQVLGQSTNIAAGDRLAPDSGSAGKGVKITADRTEYGAIALEPATADDVIIRVQITPAAQTSNA